MKEAKFPKVITSLDEQILRTLLYYDIFHYPLTRGEVHKFLGAPADESIITSRLGYLRDHQIIFQFDEFFSLENDRHSIDRRVKGNLKAKEFLILAQKKATFISKFPFVRGVLASGSLSKGYMDDQSDLDFFIITKPGRLWIARTLLVFYKRLFLLNSHKYFCVNYFVDEDHLEIEEKNLFTATELATVIPLCGATQYQRLHGANSWLREFFPNFFKRSTDNVPETALLWTKSVLEGFINLCFGNSIEKYFHHITCSRWKRLYGKNYSASDFKVAFKSKSYASKNHPRNFQRTVVEIYDEKLRSFGLRHKTTNGALVTPNYSEHY